MTVLRDKTDRFSHHNRSMDTVGELGLSAVNEQNEKANICTVGIYIDEHYKPRHERHLFKEGKDLFADCIKQMLPDSAGKKIALEYFHRKLQKISIVS